MLWVEKHMKHMLMMVFMLVFSGCASKDADIASLKRLLAAKQNRIEELKQNKADMQRVLDLKNAELVRQQNRMQTSPDSGMVNAVMSGKEELAVTNCAQGDCSEVKRDLVVCQLYATPEMVQRIQHALKQSYHYHGALDGLYGAQTRRAVASYQRSRGLSVGGITLETLQSLGIDIHNQQVVAGTK